MDLTSVLTVFATCGVVFMMHEIKVVHGLYLTPGQPNTVRSLGENAVFTCTNNGPWASIPQWRDRDGNDIRPLGSGGQANLHTVITAFEKKSQLNIFDIIESYDGVYGCVLDNGESDSRRLTVFNELSFDDELEEEFQDIIVNEADRVECTVIGNPKPTVTWSIRDVPVNPSDPRYTLQETQNGKIYKNIIAIGNVTWQEEGIFKCQASQLDQSVVKILPITVDVQEPPKIVLPPQDKNGTEGGSVTFYCRAEGDPQPTYTWYRGGGDPVQNGAKYEINDEDHQLKINELVKNDLGDYTCQAENAAGVEQAAGFLNVFIPPLMNPQNNETKKLNNMVELECFIQRGEEDTWLRWRRDGKWLKEGKQEFNERWEVFSRAEAGSTVKVLRITGITKEDEGPYTCWGENAGGEDEVNHWLLVEYTPIIDLQRSPYNVKGWVDNESNMTCFWDGYPIPTARWKKNGIPLKDGINATIETKIVTGGIITILYVTPTSLDFGPYECLAKNKWGEAIHRITFEQAFAPKKPTSVNVLEISSTTFTLDLENPEDNGGLRIEGYQVGYHIQGFLEEYQDFNATEKIKVKYLTPEREYVYRVAAVNDVGVGEFSENKTLITKYYIRASSLYMKQDDIAVTEVTLTEDVQYTITCTSLGARPVVEIWWYHQQIGGSETRIMTGVTQTETSNGDTFDTISTLQYTASRAYNDGSIRCETTGQIVAESRSFTASIYVQYPPYVSVQYGGDKAICSSEANPDVPLKSYAAMEGYIFIVNNTEEYAPTECSDGQCTLNLEVKFNTDVRCNATNSIGTGFDTTVAVPGAVITTTPEPTTPGRGTTIGGDGGGPNVGAIVGAIVAVVLVFVIVGLLAYYFLVFKKKGKMSNSQTQMESRT